MTKLRHKGNHVTKFKIFRKIMSMLVFPEDLKEKCQVLAK